MTRRRDRRVSVRLSEEHEKALLRIARDLSTRHSDVFLSDGRVNTSAAIRRMIEEAL